MTKYNKIIKQNNGVKENSNENKNKNKIASIHSKDNEYWQA